MAQSTYIGDIDSQRPDIRPRQVLHKHLVVDRITSNIDNKPPPLQIQCQRPRQRQIWRPRDHNDLQARPVPSPARAAALAAVTTVLVPAVDQHACRGDNYARQDLVSRNPVLCALVQRTGGRGNGWRGPTARSDGDGDPFLGGEGVTGLLCDFVDAAIDYVGDLVRVALDFVGDRRQLCSRETRVGG